MLAKLTAKNQLTLPKAATDAVGASEYFEVEIRAGQIVLTPVRLQRADAVRSKLEELAIDAADVADAVAWARSPASASGLLLSEPTPKSGHGAAKSPRKRAPRKPRA